MLNDKRKIALYAVIAVIVFVASYYVFIARCSIPNHPKDIKIVSSNFVPPQSLSWKLDNGLTVYYYFDPQIPLVSGTLFVSGGSLFDPLDKIGLAAATGTQMRNGGTLNYSPDMLDEKLDNLGAAIESGFDSDYGTVGFSALAEDIDEVFGIFAEVVLKPRFDSKRFELYKGQMSDLIGRRKDSAETMASMLFTQVVYGDNTVYGKYSTRKSIAAINLTDLKEFHKKFVTPENAYLAIAGSVPEDAIKNLIGTYFANWKAKHASANESNPLPEIKSNYRPGVYVLDRDFTQANILIGHLGPSRFTDDFHAMQVYNRVFGLSGFDSILFNEVRTKAGMAYSVYGGLIGAAQAGVFQIELATKNAAAGDAISKVLNIIDQYQGKPFSAEKVDLAKKALEQTFVFKFADIKGIPAREATLTLFGFPADYDKDYLKNLSLVTPQNTAETSSRWIKNNALYIIIVGKINLDDLKSQLGNNFEYHQINFDEIGRLVR